MKELPILMNTEMVRATLDGHKTQDRRPVKPQPPEGTVWDDESKLFIITGSTLGLIRKSPFGASGDHLYVRETWAIQEVDMEWDCEERIFFRADSPWESPDGGWRASIHMPKKYSRITLEVERVW